jgi:hypothetical protein
MASLLELYSQFPDTSDSAYFNAEHRFVEKLTFSSAKDIVEFMDEIYEKDFTGFPVWLRNLAFRLACLQEPNNASILWKAAVDLECFGPDWDDLAEDLRRRVEELEGSNTSES